MSHLSAEETRKLQEGVNVLTNLLFRSGQTASTAPRYSEQGLWFVVAFCNQLAWYTISASMCVLPEELRYKWLEARVHF